MDLPSPGSIDRSNENCNPEFKTFCLSTKSTQIERRDGNDSSRDEYITENPELNDTYYKHFGRGGKKCIHC